ncbi:MAG: hypothetical protein Q7T74_01820, partial [Candidatus Saccharibacteria bacterium]|nr:hypothetical protein [Candidatus Saccharibacteria bacterium]
GYLDNTDSQDLTLATNTLSLSGDGTTVDLSAYLDNTDNQNLFLTINADNGTDPVADGITDTLNLISGSGVTITGDSTTDSVTIAAVLGDTIDSSAEIVNGTVDNIDLANSAVTISAGSGLTTGGSVSLGGSVTLDIGAGNGITVNANDIAVDLTVATDALSATTSSSSGLEVLATGATLLQGCSDGQLLKWNEATDVWACGGDNDAQNIFATFDAPSGTDPVSDSTTDTLTLTAGTGLTITGNSTTDTIDIAVTADSLNFSELSDTLTIDATTTISLGANNLTTNLNSTGDFAIQFGGNTVLSILDTGAVTIGNILADQTIGIDNGTGAINISTDGDANTTNIGTGTGADTVTIGDANANVSLTDAQWSVTGAGAANFASVAGAGLTDCDNSGDVLLWDTTTSLFSCGTNRATFHNVLDGNYTNATAGLTDVDNDADATDDMGFAIGANETWVFEMWIQFTSPTAADSQWQINAPAGATCDFQYNNIEDGVSLTNQACGASTGNQPTNNLADNILYVGSISTGATAGNVQLQFRQNIASGSSTVHAGSYVTAYRVSGADYAESYFTNDTSVEPGMIVALDGSGPSQVSKANQPYSDRQIGIVSTKPGQVLGEVDGSGRPVPIALSGRVPIKLSTENGLPKAGDMVTASNTMAGYGMLATQSGSIVGQLMVDATDNGDGTANGFVYVRNGFWQAPLNINLASIFGDDVAVSLNQPSDVLGLTSVSGVQFNSLDQAAIDEILRGFTI